MINTNEKLFKVILKHFFWNLPKLLKPKQVTLTDGFDDS